MMISKAKLNHYAGSASVLALVAAWGVFGGLALAQESEGTLETVVVTGTGTNISGVAPVGTESIALDRDKILASGMTTPTDLLNTLPVVQQSSGASGGIGRQGGTSMYGGGFGSNPTQGTAINLRGLGTAATLTLINGHRTVPSGTQGTFTEATQVPLAALKRVEIVADGTSGIYGSDAIAGVVNFITRKDFDGIEFTPRLTYNDLYHQVGGSITVGHAWEHVFGLGIGNFLVSYDYDYRTPMVAGKRAYLRQNMAPLGGVDLTSPSSTGPTAGIPGYIDYQDPSSGSHTYYAIPNAANSPIAGSALIPGTWNTIDASDYQDYLGRQTRHQIAAFFNQDLTPWLSFYYEGFYTHRHTNSRNYTNTNAVANVIMSTVSPFYPTGGIAGVAPVNFNVTTNAFMYAFASPVTLHYNTYKDIGPLVVSNPDDLITQTVGFKAKLPYEWNGEVYFTAGIDHTCGICNFGNNLDTAALQYYVDKGIINPFSNAPLSEEQKKLVYGSNVQYGRNMMNDVVMKFDGPLFDLPGGTVKAAFGGEYVYTTEHLANGANRSIGNAANTIYTNVSPSAMAGRPIPSFNYFGWDNISGMNRDMESAFAEVFVPVIGEANALPFVKELNVNVAVRYDHYSDFGDTTNPKVGITWGVNDDLSIRGSGGTSFRAPTLTDLNPYVYSFYLQGLPFANNSGNPDIVNGPGNAGCFGNAGQTCAFMITGDQPNLGPEKAHTWSLGFDYAPHWLSGLKVSSTYYQILYAGQISAPNIGLFLSSPDMAKLYSKYIIPIKQPSTCVDGNLSTYDPAFVPYATAIAVYGGNVQSACAVNVVLDGRNTNVAHTFYSGLDFNVDYGFQTKDWGSFALGASLSVVLQDKQKAVDGAAGTELAGQIYYPTRFRGRVNVGWFDGPWAANLFMNYTGSYKDTATPTINGTQMPNYWVAPYITFDVNLSYRFENAVWKGLDNTMVSVHVQNLFDKDPPKVLTANSAFDPTMADPFGRVITLQLTKSLDF